ncbi:MAG: sugar phosphate isomerase/epimerase family protein [Acidimicrobiia bacterium]
MTTTTNRYAVCQIATRMGSFEADCALATASGAAAIGIQLPTIADIGVAGARRVLDASGLVVSSTMWGLDPLPSDDFATYVEQAKAEFAAAGELGSPAALATGRRHDSLGYRELDRRIREQVKVLASLAAERGTRFALEPLHPSLHAMSYVHTLDHALSLIDDAPEAGIVLDTSHTWWDARVFDVLPECIDRIATVQIADVPVESYENRQFLRGQLGEGVIPLVEFLAVTERAGYAGFYENEVILAMPRDQRVEYFTDGRRRFEAILYEAERVARS